MSSLDAVRARCACNEGLPFADILTEASIRDVLNEHGVQFRDRVFSPGRLHHNLRTEQDLREVAVVPASGEAFVLDTNLEGVVVLE